MEDKNIERLVPVRFFYSLRGIDEDNREINFLSGTIEEEELDRGINIMNALKIKAMEANNRVLRISLITLTPLAFKVVKDIEDGR